MRKFTYNPSLYDEFDKSNKVRSEILYCLCIGGIRPYNVLNSKNLQKDCFKKCLNLIKNKLEKAFSINVNKYKLKECRDIHEVYNYITHLLEDKERIKEFAEKRKREQHEFDLKASDLRRSYYYANGYFYVDY